VADGPQQTGLTASFGRHDAVISEGDRCAAKDASDGYACYGSAPRKSARLRKIAGCRYGVGFVSTIQQPPAHR
jgi:hypothetical protein